MIPATTPAIAAAATTGTPTMTTTPAVWLEAESATNGLGARDDNDERFSVVTYCTSGEARQGHPAHKCAVLTHPIGSITRTVTEYPDLPTDKEGRCDLAHEVIDATGPDSPLAADCMHLAHRIRGAGEWTVEAYVLAEHQLVEWRSCAFAIKPIQFALVVLIGNQDIIDLLRDSVRDFTIDGKVAAHGKMWCMNNPGAAVQVRWGIYKNAGW
ncbi:hypothetical protein BR93DRAFT_928375 [Coniochaeta sp. PMI_546]|nr:hypothetical protein BR93DRAFT_928375 [Coniochaeta sp. PMI_546]